MSKRVAIFGTIGVVIIISAIAGAVAPTNTPNPVGRALQNITDPLNQNLATPKSRTSFGDGTYRIGTDIDPGQYTAPGGEGCYWARLSGFGGDISTDIIANNVTVTPAVMVVAIAGSDAGFQTTSCGTWTR